MRPEACAARKAREWWLLSVLIVTSPRVAWHPSGGVLFASSQQDATVHAWELADARGRPARALAGHTAAVRDLAHDASADVLVTASFDKTVRVWGVT